MFEDVKTRAAKAKFGRAENAKNALQNLQPPTRRPQATLTIALALLSHITGTTT